VSRLAELRRRGLVAVVGPTASGKSELALSLAEHLGRELVSLDSMQVYRGMDVGTAKPGAAERARVRHHMLDLVEAREEYDIARYLADLEPVLADLAARGVQPLFVGGTGFWLKVLLEGLFDGPPVDRALRARLEARLASEGDEALHAELARRDPPSAARLHAHDARRVVRALEVLEQTGRPLSDWQREWASFGGSGAHAAHRLLGLAWPTDELDRRIRARVERMLAQGWPAEVEALEARGGFSKTSIQALGYREVRELVAGRSDAAGCCAAIALATRQFARRQRTWYRKFPITWLAGESAETPRAAEGLLEAAVRALA